MKLQFDSIHDLIEKTEMIKLAFLKNKEDRVAFCYKNKIPYTLTQFGVAIDVKDIKKEVLDEFVKFLFVIETCYKQLGVEE